MTGVVQSNTVDPLAATLPLALACATIAFDVLTTTDWTTQLAAAVPALFKVV
jgi:hypothetical protein